MAHIPVLLKEVIDSLEFSEKDQIFLDATVGAGGHSFEICRRYPWIQIIGIDVDEDAAEFAQSKLGKGGCQFSIKIGNFRDLGRILQGFKIKNIDKAIFDLGMSSMQIDLSGRGFSFQRDEPLFMTMKKYPDDEELTAYEIVNSWSREEIERILREYGEESFAGRIAASIADERKKKRIETTMELANIIAWATPRFYRHKKIHPATKTFQALRITVNDELNSITEGLAQAFQYLRIGGRLAVISFHGLEDKVVKFFFKELAKEERGLLIFKKPVTPSFEEVKINPRSRSAKLRVIEKI